MRIKLNKKLSTIAFLLVACSPQVGMCAKEGKTFETKGVADVLANSTFTISTEEKNISIPRLIDVTQSSKWNGLYHDREAGWTRCRVPLKSELSW